MYHYFLRYCSILTTLQRQQAYARKGSEVVQLVVSEVDEIRAIKPADHTRQVMNGAHLLQCWYHPN